MLLVSISGFLETLVWLHLENYPKNQCEIGFKLTSLRISLINMLFSIPLLLRKKNIYNFSGNHYAKKVQYFSESPSVITPQTSVLTLLKKNNSSLRENKHTAKALGALSKVPCTARGFLLARSWLVGLTCVCFAPCAWWALSSLWTSGQPQRSCAPGSYLRAGAPQGSGICCSCPLPVPLVRMYRG